jgi:methyl-accepting chemotaxis protein/sigma-B regulation protein RsbU (phosphoserine phosphatase)
VGVLATDLLLKPFSQAVHEIKPSPNSYCTLLANDGTYIVHPDSSKLLHQTVFTATECHSSSRKAAEAIMSGDTDYKPFSLNGKDYLVFYKPFSRVGLRGRATDNLGWKAGIIYPEADIFGDYNSLLYYVLAIAIVGIILLFVLSRAFIHRQLIPLRLLTASAQRIAQGNYDELIPDSQQQDEIGRLQNHFLQMQQSLALQVGEYEQLTATLKKRGEDLRVAYEKAQLADRLKTAFLHNMTDQMADPAGIIEDHVNTLCENKCSISEEDANKLTDDILLQGETITELLNHLLHVSEEETGKEVAHA